MAYDGRLRPMPSSTLLEKYPCVDCVKEAYVQGDIKLAELEWLMKWHLEAITR